MNIEQTKCDHCGKLHNTPGKNTPGKNFSLQDHGLVSVQLDAEFCYTGVVYKRTAEEILMAKNRYPKSWGRHFFDFCNEDCLREYLVKKKEAQDEVERTRSVEEPPQPPVEQPLQPA